MLLTILLIHGLITGYLCAFGDVHLNTTVTVVRGQSIRMPCKSDQSKETIHWYFYSLTNPRQTIVYNGEEMSHQFKTRLSTDMEKPGQCDLILSYARVNDAGTYECLGHIPSPQRPDRSKPVLLSAIQLTVMDTYPICSSINNSSTNKNGYYVKGDLVDLSCSFNYSGSSRPVIKWMRNGREVYMNDINHAFNLPGNLNSYGATSSIVADVDETDEDLLYTCVASFGAVQHHQSATNFFKILDQLFQCNLTIRVAFAVRNVTISPIKFQYFPGDQLRCNAEGSPSPTYEWSQLGTSKVVIGPVMILDETMAGEHEYTFMCNASNQVNGERKSITTNIKFIVLGRTWHSGLPMAGALGGVGFLAIAISVILLQRFLRSKCRKKRLATTDDNGDNSERVNASSLPSSRDYESVNEVIDPTIIRFITASTEHQLPYSTGENYFPLIAGSHVELPMAYCHLEILSNPAEGETDLIDPEREVVRVNPCYANVTTN